MLVVSVKVTMLTMCDSLDWVFLLTSMWRSDVGQIKAQALILDEAEAAHCRSPFNAQWA